MASISASSSSRGSGFDYYFHRTVAGGVDFQLFVNDEKPVMGSQLRLEYHLSSLLNWSPEVDLYLGPGMTYISQLEYEFDNGLYWVLNFGGRYYWSRNWGVQMDVGMGGYFATKLGITYSLF